MELFLIKPIPTQRNYMLALDDCQDVRHLSSLAMHMNDITFSQRSFGKPYNKRVIFPLLLKDPQWAEECFQHPLLHPQSTGVTQNSALPNAVTWHVRGKLPSSPSDFLLHRGSEEVESKCLVDHTHSTFDKASFCRSVHYLRNTFNQNSWKYFCHQHWLKTKSGTELHFMTLPGSDYVFSDWLKCGVNPLKLMISLSQSYWSPSHYFDFALA